MNRIKYKIIGKDSRYSISKKYGEFETLRDCLYHMNGLNRSFGDFIKFKYVEVQNNEKQRRN